MPGSMIHLHSYSNNRNLGGAVMASPGRVTELLIGRSVFNKKKRFPWTNCYASSVTETTQCQNTCLKKVQAEECCGMSLPPIRDGRFPAMASLDPAGQSVPLDNPVLDCNILDSDLQQCLNKQIQLYSEGTICIDGPSSESSTAYWYVRGLRSVVGGDGYVQLCKCKAV